ncbi:MAG: hypothetical protein LBP56_05560 [Odoribacteraceae bacterium]|nr:hypothetical protein [Odoribacteraceae bacterium]
MRWARKYKKWFLYGGLGMLAIAFSTRLAGGPAGCFRPLLGAAILFKVLFLLLVFPGKGFRPRAWFWFILAGVILILLSQLFKALFPVPALYKSCFYGAIALKMTGLILLLFSKRGGLS